MHTQATEARRPVGTAGLTISSSKSRRLLGPNTGGLAGTRTEKGAAVSMGLRCRRAGGGHGWLGFQVTHSYQAASDPWACGSACRTPRWRRRGRGSPQVSSTWRRKRGCKASRRLHGTKQTMARNQVQNSEARTALRCRGLLRSAVWKGGPEINLSTGCCDHRALLLPSPHPHPAQRAQQRQRVREDVPYPDTTWQL